MEKKKRAADSSDSRTVLDAIRRIVRALRLASRAAEKEAGLSGAQLFVLQKLSGEHGISINEIAARTLTHQSSVSVVVQRLVERGLVRRKQSTRDARRLELELTAKGIRAAGSRPDLAQVSLIKALDSMSASQRGTLARLMSELVERAGFAGEPAELFFESGIARRSKK